MYAKLAAITNVQRKKKMKKQNEQKNFKQIFQCLNDSKIAVCVGLCEFVPAIIGHITKSSIHSFKEAFALFFYGKVNN